MTDTPWQGDACSLVDEFRAGRRSPTEELQATLSAIASSSLVTEWLKGKTLDQASEIKNSAIAEELALPPVKIHCSILAEDAIKSAINDYRKKQGLEEIIFEASHV